jgi:hypothetical protein
MRIALVAVACLLASVGSKDIAAQAPTTFTVSGTVTDNNGQPLADVTMILLSDVTGTQITFTNQSGNYSFTYAGGVSHSLTLTASRDRYIFNPLTVIFLSSGALIGDWTQSFVGTQSPIPLPILQTPFLLTQENSLRALALDSVTWTAETFGVAGDHNFSTDHHTRVSLFAVNIELRQGEPLSAIEAQAEDAVGQIFPLTVEYYGAVPNFTWLKQVVVKLPDAIANGSEVRMSLKVHGAAGNKVIVKVKP